MDGVHFGGRNVVGMLIRPAVASPTKLTLEGPERPELESLRDPSGAHGGLCEGTSTGGGRVPVGAAM